MKSGIFRSSALAALAAALVTALPQAAACGEPDSTMVLEGGTEGTAFKKMTIEGEDRFRIDFERPDLRIALDPAAAPGLDWDNTWDVLGRGAIDLRAPLTGTSSTASSPYLPRPWLEKYRSGDIVAFRPALKQVERWRLTIADPLKGEVRAFEGKGDPPDRIGWNGLSQSGTPMQPGYTYSYVVEAWDRAGNRRNFVGKGFGLPAYRIETDEGIHFMFGGDEIRETVSSRSRDSAAAPQVILEAASRINQIAPVDRRVRVVVTARTFDQASEMAGGVTGSLGSLLLGSPARIQDVVDVRADAPEAGTVVIVLEPAG